MNRVLVIGLDGLSPELVDAWRTELPNLSALMASGIYGPLESIVQPVTPPAWTAMLSGRNPGHFGFTDFAARVGNSYTDFRMVHSRLIRVDTLPGLLSSAGRNVLMVGVPVSYPPVRVPGGACVSCFMAPSVEKGITQPPELQAEIMAQTTAPYLLDASAGDARDGVDRAELLGRIRELDRQRFDVASYLLRTRSWDLLFMVAMGTDRIGHYFMRFTDAHHRLYQPDPSYRDAIREHYAYCDARIGGLLAEAGPETVVMVVSDHGVQRLDGRVHLNTWLAREGYLCLTEPVDGRRSLANAPVDWSRTRAWARGFGGQIYLNVRGREPRGCVDPDDADRLLGEIGQRLRTLTDADGRPLRVNLIPRREIYSGPYADICPDLFVQFNQLRYLTSDALGSSEVVTPVRWTDIEDGSHAGAGFFALAGPGIPSLGRFEALHLLDVAPTILDLLGVPLPPDLDGRPVHHLEEVYSDEDQAALTSRLSALYLA